ncbi:hypothetical protein CK203_026644 [Vitis vinifera]|uniref:Uncharacterized protein n=1 Tax=Vitis vinifera TaxID=29760 RepID=A0A438IU45_VITVI|nr:hypothetical protein CK203_026644 [Vitis vinifera]
MNAVFLRHPETWEFGDIRRRHPRKRASLARKWNPQFDLFVGSATGGSLSAGPNNCYWSCNARFRGRCILLVSLLLVLFDSTGERLNWLPYKSVCPSLIRPGFSRPARLCPIWPMTDACTRSAELPGSTKIRLTSKSPISRERMRASRCGCSVRQFLPFPPGIVFLVRWAPVDIVYDSLGGDWGPRGPRVMM